MTTISVNLTVEEIGVLLNALDLYMTEEEVPADLYDTLLALQVEHDQSVIDNEIEEAQDEEEFGRHGDREDDE